MSLAIRHRILPSSSEPLGRSTTVVMKPSGVPAPSLTTSDRTAAICSDGAVISAHYKAAASGDNVLERVSTVSAQLQHSAIVADILILFGRLKIEIVPEG